MFRKLQAPVQIEIPSMWVGSPMNAWATQRTS